MLCAVKIKENIQINSDYQNGVSSSIYSKHLYALFTFYTAYYLTRPYVWLVARSSSQHIMPVSGQSKFSICDRRSLNTDNMVSHLGTKWRTILTGVNNATLCIVDHLLKRYKQAMIRKRRNQKEIPNQTEVRNPDCRFSHTSAYIGTCRVKILVYSVIQSNQVDCRHMGERETFKV